ncbi:hypothetical protein D3C72_2470000 [compost metagenome]
MRMTPQELRESDGEFYRSFLVLFCGFSEQEVAELTFEECEESYLAWIAVK